MPSAFSITFGVLPSITATHELVVPRSIPMTLPMVLTSSFSAAGRPGPFGTRREVTARSRAPSSDPLNAHRCRPLRRLGSYRRHPLSRKPSDHGFARRGNRLPRAPHLTVYQSDQTMIAPLPHPLPGFRFIPGCLDRGAQEALLAE